jgi:hypothetical protein
MIQIVSTRQAAAMHGIKVLVHGRAGTGKTTLCKTAPDPIILSAEAGLLSLRNVDLPTIVIRSMSDLYDAYRFFTQSAESRQFRTVCLDSISEIAEVVLGKEKIANKDPRKAYGNMADTMFDLIRAFRDLPDRNVYFSAKQTRNKDEVTGVTLYGPLMPGQQVGPQLPYFFDEVFCLDVARDNQTQQVVHFLRTTTDLQYDAKDRSGALDMYEPPDLSHIFAKIMRG